MWRAQAPNPLQAIITRLRRSGKANKRAAIHTACNVVWRSHFDARTGYATWTERYVSLNEEMSKGQVFITDSTLSNFALFYNQKHKVGAISSFDLKGFLTLNRWVS
jgi:hypothetical protein